MPRITRRDLLKSAFGAGAISTLGACARFNPGSEAPQRDLIARENARGGTRDWLLTNTRVDPGTKYRCPWIEGYCSRTSIGAGESLSIHVGTNPASSFTLDIYRMGFYGGAGARHVQTPGPFKGTTQPDPSIGKNRVLE